jgi:hypothetical protein
VTGGPGAIWTPQPVAPTPKPDRPDDAAPEPPQTSRWYGGQTLFVDGTSIGLVVLGATQESSGLIGLGVSGYLLGGPIVHWAHGHAGKGFGSLGLRVGLPIGGALAGVGLANCHGGGGGYCGLGEALVGFSLGIIGAIVIDSAALAYEDVPVESRPTARVAPSLQVSQSSVCLGLVGAF